MIAGRIAMVLKYVILVTYLVAVVYPLAWLFYTSAKSTREIYAHPFGLPRLLTAPSRANAQSLIDNYDKAWVQSHFSSYFINSNHSNIVTDTDLYCTARSNGLFIDRCYIHDPGRSD